MQLKTINPAPVMQIIYPALLALEKKQKNGLQEHLLAGHENTGRKTE